MTRFNKWIIKDLLIFNEKYRSGSFDIDLEILAKLRLINPIAIAPINGNTEQVVMFGEYDYYVKDIENNAVSRDITTSHRLLFPLLNNWHFTTNTDGYQLVKIQRDIYQGLVAKKTCQTDPALLVCRMMLLGLLYDSKNFETI